MDDVLLFTPEPIRKVLALIKSIWSSAIPYTRVVGGHLRRLTDGALRSVNERRTPMACTLTSNAESDLDGFNTVLVQADDRQRNLAVLSVDIDTKREIAG